MLFSDEKRKDTSSHEQGEFWDPKKLRQLVLMDDLTGLFNRRYFRLRLDEEEKRCRKHGKKFSLMMIDVNRFKEINDAYGHLIGDRVLVQVGTILKESVRDEDIVCRWAGDEFVVILPEAMEKEAFSIARRIVRNVRTYSWEEKCEARLEDVSVSLGFAVFPEDAVDLVSLLEFADQALYLSKTRGKPVRVRHTDGGNRKSKSRDRVPMVFGKKWELDLLLKGVGRAEAGDPGFFLVRGELGLGKTFLMEQVAREVAHRKMLTLRGKCNEETAEVPLAPFKDLLTHSLANEQESRIIDAVDLPDASLVELARLAPRWVRASSLPKTRRGTGGRDRFLVFEAFRQFLMKLAEAVGVVMIIEDIHWADVTSLSLLHFLSRTMESGRIMIVCTCRPAADSPERSQNALAQRELQAMEREGRYRKIALRSLSKQESLAMIRTLLKGEETEERVMEELSRLTEGNPFFIRGMVDYLKKSQKQPGLISDLPPTIQEATNRRIEKMSPEARKAFQAASVLGNEFEFDVLLTILQTNEGFLLDIIDEGIQGNIIQEVREFNGDRYVFVQNFIAHALYAGIPETTKVELHRRAAAAIEQYDPHGVEERSEELAHHFEAGGDHGKAFEYAVRAARKARDLFAYDEAVVFYGKALKLYRSGGKWFGDEHLLILHEERGLVHQQIGDYRRAQRDIESVLELSTALGDERKLGMALKNLASISIFKREFEAAYDYSMRTLRHAIGTGDDGLKAESLAAFGNIYLFSGEYDRALKFYDRALEMDRRQPDQLRLSKIFMNMGVIYWYKEERDRAEAYYRKTLRILEEAGNKTYQPLCRNNLAIIALQRGQYENALSLAERALENAKETGNRIIEAYSYNNISEIFQRIGDYSKAYEWSRKAIDHIKQVKDQGSKSDFIRNRGMAGYFLGDPRKARRDLERALVLSRNTGKKEYEMNDLFWLIRINTEEGSLDTARQYLTEFEALASNRKSREYTVKFMIATLILMQAEGRAREALDRLGTVRLDAGELDPYLELLYHYQNARLLREIGRLAAGKREIDKALRIAGSISRKFKDRKMRECFRRSRDVVRVRELAGSFSSPISGQ